MIVTIDPGVRFTGVAVWGHFKERYFLHRAHLIKNTAKDLAMSVINVSSDAFIGNYAFEAVVIELPQVYGVDKSKVDPNDLIAVAAVAGGIMETYARLSNVKHKLLVLPAEWKGQTKKVVTKNRCLADLRRRELENVMLVKSAKQNENIYDAIGIGLWYLKKHKLRSASPERSMAGLSEANVN